MGKIAWKGGAMLAPVPPALVSCGTPEHPNVLTVAWTGIVCTSPAMTYVSIRPSRYSYNIIKESSEFAINLPTVALARAVDGCGVYTGAKVDKFARFGLTALPGMAVGCPILGESPLSLECRVKEIIPLGTHDMFLAEILATDVDEELVDKEGKLRLEKAGLLAYAHGTYFELGKPLGGFGYSVRKKTHKPAPQKK